MIDAAAVAQAIVDETKGCGKPALACVMGRQRGDEAQRILRDAGIPVFRYPEDAATTLMLMLRRHRWLERRPARGPPRACKREVARRSLRRQGRRGWLPSAEAEAVLAAYGIPFPTSRRVRSAGEAVAAAHELGWPVVLKAEADELLHKSEHRAVRVSLRDGDEVYAAAKDLLSRLQPQFPDVRLQVQSQAVGHREVLVGMTRDPRYGPLYAVGLGGVHVEALRDVVVRVGPLDGKDPGEMFQRLQGRALLDAFRGAPAADVAAACTALLRMQQLAVDFPEIAEVEVNPFILAEKGKRSVAVDARLRVEER